MADESNTGDGSGLQQDVRSLRASILQAENLLRVMQSQVLNYEDVDETRRALIEHLLAERQTLLTEREGLADRTQRRIELVQRENQELGERLSAAEEDAAATATRALEEALAEELRRTDEIENKLRAVREAHDAALVGHRQLVGTLEQQIQAEHGTADEIRQRGEAAEEAERERAAELSRRVEQLRDDLERSTMVDQERIGELLADLEKARETARTLSVAAEQLNGKLDVVREATFKLRAKIKDRELMVSEPAAAEARPTRQPTPPPDPEPEAAEQVPPVSERQRETAPKAQAEPGSAAASGPVEDGTPGSVAESAETSGAAQRSKPVQAPAARRPVEAGGEEHVSFKSVLTLAQFRDRFDSGCRVVQTSRFHDVMPVDRPSLVIRDALDRTQRSEEIAALVPPTIRRRLVELLFRMYGRGTIELADLE